MEKLSANRLLSRIEFGGVTFSQSGDEIPRPHTFKVVMNFFHRRQFSSPIFHPRPGHTENNFEPPGDVEIRIANNINAFMRFSLKISAVYFVQWLAQRLPQILPDWLRMRNFSINSDLSGGDFRPSFFASVLPTTKKVSRPVATRESESIFLHASKTFPFDQDLICEAIGFGQNEAMKCFDADGETGRWFLRRFSATSFWLKASTTTQIKAFLKIIWIFCHETSCVISAQCDFKILITLLRMVNVSAHKYRPDARKRFAGHPPQNYFATGKLAVAVRSNRQPGNIFRRWPATVFHRALPMPDFNDFFDLKNLRFFLFLIHRPLRRKTKRAFHPVLSMVLFGHG